MSSPLRESLKTNLIDGFQDHGVQSERAIRVLSQDNVTAWAVKPDQRDYFQLIEPGDYFILRTSGNDPDSRYYEWVQKIDYRMSLNEDRAFRRAVGGLIWDDMDYELIWFSGERPTHIQCSERIFDNFIQEKAPAFSTQVFFPSQKINFKPLNRSILNDFGGADEFVNKLVDFCSYKEEPDW